MKKMTLSSETMPLELFARHGAKRWRLLVQVGDLVTWTQRNEQQIGIIVADPDFARKESYGAQCWSVFHDGEITIAREEWLQVLNESR